MLQEQMEKLLTVLAVYEPNPAWKFEIFILILAAIIIGIFLNNLYK
jgi:hypothetical protein